MSAYSQTEEQNTNAKTANKLNKESSYKCITLRQQGYTEWSDISSCDVPQDNRGQSEASKGSSVLQAGSVVQGKNAC